MCGRGNQQDGHPAKASGSLRNMIPNFVVPTAKMGNGFDGRSKLSVSKIPCTEDLLIYRRSTSPQ